MAFNKEDSKGFRNSRNPTKIPRSPATSAHPHIKMNTSTPTFTSPMNSKSNRATSRTPQTLTLARPVAKGNGKGKGRSRKTSFSKIPSSAGSTRSHASTIIRTTPVSFAHAGRIGSSYRDAPSITSSDSGSTIRENIAEAMATDRFAMPSLNLPLSPQNNSIKTVANTSSLLLDTVKILPTTGLPPPKPITIKGAASQMESPQIYSDPMASPDVPNTMSSFNTSYTSFTHTPLKVTTTASTPSVTRKPAGSSLPRPVQKQTQSTPLLPKRHRSSTESSRHIVSFSVPSEFYEYHTINSIIVLPNASKNYLSGDSSGYDSGISGSGSTPSSRASLRHSWRGFLNNVKPRVLYA